MIQLGCRPARVSTQGLTDSHRSELTIGADSEVVPPKRTTEELTVPNRLTDRPAEEDRDRCWTSGDLLSERAPSRPLSLPLPY